MRRALPIALALAALLGGAPAAGAEDRIVIVGDVAVAPGEEAGTVIVADGDVDVAGRTTGDVIALAGDVTVTGEVGGDLVTFAGRATVASTGVVAGDLRWGEDEPRLAGGATVRGEVDEEELTSLSPTSGSVIGLGIWLAISVSTLALGLLSLWLAPRAAEAALAAAREQIGGAIGLGLLLLVGIPVGAALAFATLVGIPFGIGVLLAFAPLLALAYVTAAWLLGRWIAPAPRRRLVAFLAGWGVLRFGALLPWVGIMAWLGATAVGLGALALALWRSREAARPTPPQLMTDAS